MSTKISLRSEILQNIFNYSLEFAKDLIRFFLKGAQIMRKKEK